MWSKILDELPEEETAGGGMPFDTQPPQPDVPDVVSNRGLLASTAKGIPIAPPSEEESDRLIRAEQLNKEPEIRRAEPADRINVPELDLGPHNTQVVDAPPVKTDREIPIFDPSEAKLVDEKDIPLSERINPAETRITDTPGAPGQPVAKVTAYRPGGGPSLGLSQSIEGGINDAHDTPILGKTTMEDYQAGRGDYVTVAMDKNSSWQNQFLTSPAFPGTVFRVRDNGGYGNGKTGENWIDVAFTDPQKAKSMMLHGVPFNPVTPEEAQKISESRPYVENPPDLKNADITPPTTSGFGRMAGIPKIPESFSTQHAYDSAMAAKENALKALEGLGGSLQGSSAALAKYVAKPIFGGIQNAIHALAPDSELSKYTAGLYDKFNKFAVEETGKAAAEKLTPPAGESTMGEISRMIGTTVGDIAQIVPTAVAGQALRGAPLIERTAEAAAPTVFNIIKAQIPKLGQAAESMAVPALRSGMQASDMAARMGASPADQNLAFTKAALLTMGSAALPLGVESNAANMFARFIERAAKAAPLGIAAGAATQGAENILSPGEARPFDPKQLTINAVPIVLLAGALGHHIKQRPQGPIAQQAFSKGEPAPPMPGGDVRFAPLGAPTAPPPGAPPIPPPVPGRVPRIVPVIGTLRKFPFLEFDLNRSMQGTAAIFEKSGVPQLGQAIRNHYDRFRFYSGMTSTPIRQWAKGITRGELKTAHDEFKAYWQSVDEKGLAHPDSQALYNSAGAKGQELIEVWKQLADQTGNIAVRNGLEVYNHDTATWRPFHKIGPGFFPRRISAKWLEYMSKPDQYPAEMADLRREILASGYVNQLSDVDAYIARALKNHTPDDLSPLEHARTSPLPNKVYDYSFDTALNYLRNWSYDMARIEAYGQKKFGGDEFTKAEGQVNDTYSKEYIKQIQGIAYRKVNKGSWVKGINLGTNVSTFNMLGNFLSSMNNAIGGILYNAVYNGVPPAVKALVNVKKTAATIDDAYELGVLQDNLHNLQQDVHNMTPAARGVDVALKTSGYQLVEEWTRSMNLLAARDFLRKAIAENQKNPVSGKTVQYLARIARVGGIDPQALLREGGVGPITDRYLRQNVAMIQGGYGFDQTPAWVNQPSGRMIMQFQKWGTQAADTFVKNVSNPALQAISGGYIGKKETVQVPTPGGGYRDVQVPGSLLPVARFLLLSTAAGLAQKELREFLFGIKDKEASFAEILSRVNQGDSKAFGDLIHKVWMANMSVGAAGIIGNYSQMFTDITQRTRFKDPTTPPILAMPKALGDLLITGFSQGQLTGRDFDQALATINSGYRTLRGTAARLNDAFGGDILPLKALSNRQEVSWLRSVTQRYDNVLGVQQPVFAPGSVGKNPLSPFTADLKEALLMGDQGRAADLLDAHLDPMTPTQRKVEMERIKQSVRGSHPIRVGGGTGQAMQANFLDWSEENLPIKDQLKIVDIAERYENTAVGLKLMKPNEATSRERSKALKRIEDKVAIREGQ